MAGDENTPGTELTETPEMELTPPQTIEAEAPELDAAVEQGDITPEQTTDSFILTKGIPLDEDEPLSTYIFPGEDRSLNAEKEEVYAPTPEVLAEIKAENPAPSAEQEAEQRRLEEEAEQQRRNETQIKAVLSQVVDNPETDLDKMLSEASLQELVILMEELSSRDVDRNTVRMVGPTKKRFDEVFATTLVNVNTRLELATVREAPLSEVDALKAEKNAFTTYSQRFSRGLAVYNRKRHTYEQQQTVEREANAKVKSELLTKLRELVMTEQVQSINKVRDIQKKWRETGPVPHTEFEHITESYRALLDQFYGLRAQYNELLEQDRKYNLEEKERLIHEMETIAEAMEDETDAKVWQATADRVSAMHETWKHVGPIPREDTEPMWERFKAVTDRFYDLRRGFFDTRDEQRGENTEKKQAIVEQLKPFAAFEGTTKEEWQKAGETVQALQEQWRDVGPAKRELGKQLFRSYRDTLNAFYKARSAYFETLNAARTGLVDTKQALLNQAEALVAAEETTTLQDQAEQYKALQRAWKETGSDDYRDARKIAKKFRKICDRFFAKLKESYAAQLAIEEANLAQKVVIIERLEAMALGGEAIAGINVADEVKALQAQWDSIGHVPFKQKDKTYTRYRKAVGNFGVQEREERQPRTYGGGGGGGNTSGGNNRGGIGGNNRGGGGGDRRDRPDRERKDRDYKPFDPDAGASPEKKRLSAQLKKVEESINTYENNILFISKSKSGDALRKDIESKIAEAKIEQAQIKKDIKALNS